MSRQQRRARERAERKRSNQALKLAAGIGALALASSASANTITVNSLADTLVAGDTQCTLREAIANANADAQTTGGDCNAGSGADTIVFQAGLTGTINLDLGELQLSDALTINGPGASVITISGEQSTRLFNIDSPASTTPANFNINNLTLTQGASGDDGGAITDDNENLTLDHVVISGNTAFNTGGGVYVNAYYSPSIVITNSTISGNTANGAGGGLEVYYALYNNTTSVYLKNDTITGNQAGYDGGGVDIYLGTDTGSVTILNTVVTNNTAGTVADTAGNAGGVRVHGPGEGGALPVTIDECVISGNVADPMDAAAALGGGNTSNDVGFGGGVYLAGVAGTIRRTTITGNTAYDGAGVYVSDYAVVTVENVTIANNTAKNISVDGFGGGIGVTPSGGNGTIVNVNESTITGNSAETGGGGIDISGTQGLTVTLYNSIVANNSGTSPDINGTVTSTYSLIKSTTGATINGGTGDITGSDPNLGALAINGSAVVAGNTGSTQTPLTELPNSGSPVINAGDPAFTPPPTTDERAFPRVVGGRIDMGAVETQPVITINSVALPEGNSGTTAFTFTVTLSAPSSSTVTVNFTTADGSATVADSDYAAQSGIVTFTPGQTSQPITINVNGDTKFEPNETFTVVLSTPVNATISSGTGTGTIQNDDAQTADLSIAKVLNGGPFSVGNNGTYTITVTNGGPATATGVTVTDTIPAGTSFVSAVPSQGSCSGTSTITCTLGTINNGANATIALTVHFNQAGTVTNTATVTSPDDTNATNNTATSAPATIGNATAIPALDPAALAMLAALLAFLGVAVVKK